MAACQKQLAFVGRELQVLLQSLQVSRERVLLLHFVRVSRCPGCVLGARAACAGDGRYSGWLQSARLSLTMTQQTMTQQTHHDTTDIARDNRMQG